MRIEYSSWSAQSREGHDSAFEKLLSFGVGGVPSDLDRQPITAGWRRLERAPDVEAGFLRERFDYVGERFVAILGFPRFERFGGHCEACGTGCSGHPLAYTATWRAL